MQRNSCLVWNAKLGQGGRFATFHRVKAEFAQIGRVSREGTHLVFEYYFHTLCTARLHECNRNLLKLKNAYTHWEKKWSKRYSYA